MGREVFDADEWQGLPLGTVARVETFEELDDGTQKDIIVYVLRVDADIRVDAGPYMLAGGSQWRYAWEWAEGGTVEHLPDLTGSPDAREVFDQQTWNDLPVGTTAHVTAGATDGNENLVETYSEVIRVEGDVRLEAGAYRLLGGEHWKDAFISSDGVFVPGTLQGLMGQGGMVADLSELLG